MFQPLIDALCKLNHLKSLISWSVTPFCEGPADLLEGRVRYLRRLSGMAHGPYAVGSRFSGTATTD